MNSRKKEILKEVALRLKELREQQVCSPVEMASRLGISRGAYNKNEHGINFPCIDTQRRLSEEIYPWIGYFLTRGQCFIRKRI
jgi:transcriptional regulator with XRE-family HTH domain